MFLQHGSSCNAHYVTCLLLLYSLLVKVVSSYTFNVLGPVVVSNSSCCANCVFIAFCLYVQFSLYM